MKTPAYSSIELKTGIENRDPKIFIYIEKNFKPKIYAMLKYLGAQNDELEETLMRTFLVVINSIDEGKYKECGQFEAWFKRVAKNNWFSYCKRKKKKTDLFTSGISDVDQLIGREEKAHIMSIEIREKSLNPKHQQLKCLMNNLSTEEQLILTRHIIDEWTYREIAKCINKTETNVKVIAHRAKEKLKHRLLESSK